MSLYKKPEWYSDCSTKDYTDMARIGFTSDGYEVYINSDDEGKIPHFHYRKARDLDSFHTSIKIESSEYFYHLDDQRILNLDQKKNLISFLKSKCRNIHFDTNWDYLISSWNLNNDETEVDENLEMPNYEFISPRNDIIMNLNGKPEGFKENTDYGIVGYINDDYIVYIDTDDSGKIPHFHFKKANDYDPFYACIKIESPEYFYHSSNQDALNSDQKEEMIDFLKSECVDYHYANNLELLLSNWNMDNDIQVDWNQDMPDYNLL